MNTLTDTALSAAFVQDLKDDLAAIREADGAMNSDDQEGVSSTGAVGRLIKAGMAEVTQLDAIMRNKYARNPDKLTAWDSASHIERAPQRERKRTTAAPHRPRRRSKSRSSPAQRRDAPRSGACADE
jgi:hypothetical protein